MNCRPRRRSDSVRPISVPRSAERSKAEQRIPRRRAGPHPWTMTDATDISGPSGRSWRIWVSGMVKSDDLGRNRVRAGYVEAGMTSATHDLSEVRLLTPAEVATAFRVDPKTVTRWAKAGKLTAIRTLGGHRRFQESEVLALLHDTE